MTIFAGIMLRINDTPKIYSWIYDISVLKHCMQGILHAIYGYNRSALPCPEVSLLIAYILSVILHFINIFMYLLALSI